MLLAWQQPFFARPAAGSSPETMYEFQAGLALLVASDISGILPRRPSTDDGYFYYRILFLRPHCNQSPLWSGSLN